MIVLLGAMVLMQSCAKYSDTELAGVAAVHQLYQGNISYSKHFGAEGDYFLVKLTNTEIPLELDNTLEIAGHNIGLMMYEHFTEDERKQYDWVKVEVVTSKGPQSRTVSLGILAGIWDKRAQSLADLQLLTEGRYQAYYRRLKTQQQQQFVPEQFDSLVGAIFTETGALAAPIELGVDTVGYKKQVVGTYYYGLKSATDGTIRLAYRATYALTETDSIIDFSLQSLLQ